MKNFKAFTLLLGFTFIMFSCSQDVSEQRENEPDEVKTINDQDYARFANSMDRILSYHNKVYTESSSRDGDFNPIPYLEQANPQYPEDLVAEYNNTPEFAALGEWDNIEDFINDPILSPASQMALTTLFAGFDDTDVQMFLDIVEGAPDDETAKQLIADELINRLNEWYNMEAPNLNSEDAADLLEAKLYAEASIPTIIDSELSDISNARKGGKFKKWLKKNLKKVVSVVKGVVTGVKKGIKVGKSVGKPVLGGIIGGLIGGGKSLYITWKWNVCWFFGCEQCCNNEEETENYNCANLFNNCPGQTDAPWESFECEGQQFSFTSFKEYCKHFKD